MDHQNYSNLRKDTANYFDSINFTELNDIWVEGVIDNEFTDVEENTMSISILFVSEPLQTLSKLADVCHCWCQMANNEELSTVSHTGASIREDVLWTVLDEMDINIKQIQCIIYLLCHRAVKTDSSRGDMSFGLASARLYFTLLKVPGSGAYSVFHPSLFNLCIDCLPAPDFTSDRDSSILREFQKISSMYTSTLISLIPVLKDIHLGSDSHTIEHAIKKLFEVTACEVFNRIQFNINYLELGERELRKRHTATFIATALAYQALSAVLDTNLNGDKDKNCLVILSYLNKHILCYKAKKSASVSQKHLIIKDNAVNFVCYNLETKDFFSEVTQTSVKRLCLTVPDKTEIRNIVTESITNIILCMKDEHFDEMLEWILLFIDSADSKDRQTALDIFGQLLHKTDEADTNLLPDSLKDDTSRVKIVFAILTRCDDINAAVRARALNILSQNIKCILNFLDRTKDHKKFIMDDSEDANDKDLDVNGNHRYFWYNLSSFRERLNEMAAILQRRIEDNNVNACKAALLALKNLIIFDSTYITEENLKLFDSATKSKNLVKRQVMQSLSEILETYKDNADIQQSWLRCILPLIHDPESGVQGKALSVLEEMFLQNIFSSHQAERECAFTLLRILTSGDFLAHQRYLQMSFSSWKSENKLRPQVVVHLEKYIGTEWEECIWFYICNFAMFSTLPPRMANLCVEEFEKLNSKGECPPFLMYMMKIILHSVQKLSVEKSEAVRNVVSDGLKSFSVPLELIPIYVEILYKIFKLQKAETEFEIISSLIIQKCENHLVEIQLAESLPQLPSEDLLAKYFCSIKEFCQLCPSNITPSVIYLLKVFTASVLPPKSLYRILTPSLKAHAFAALGKVCLQDEILAKDVLPVYAKELYTSKYDVIRSNIVVILIEMCKRYTSFADKYVTLICSCFKDKLYLIRYQTIVLVVNLLQEGYIKWRGPLFFCLLSTLVDKKLVIQELGRYSLSQLLQDKKRNLFSEHFIDSIFVFNNYPPPDNETAAESVKSLEQFALAGESKREERVCLYRFLLESIDIKEKAYLIKSIGDILANVAESVYPLNPVTECIVRDCFAILTLKEIGVVANQLDARDDANEMDIQKVEQDLKEVKRVVIIEPIIPIIISLKDGVTDPRSDLMHDIILFLKELLHDFRDNLKDILVLDKVLLRQLQLEILNEAEKERSEKRIDRDLREKNKQTSSEDSEKGPPVTIDAIQTLIHNISKIEEDKGDSQKMDCAPLPQTPRVSNRSNHVRHPQRSGAVPGTSKDSIPNDQHQTYNFASSTPAEAAEIRRLASTPRVVLTHVQVPHAAQAAEIQRLASTPRVILTHVQVPHDTNMLNISAIDHVNEPMNIADSDEDIS